MKRRSQLTGAAACLLTLSLAACGSSGGGSSAGGSGGSGGKIAKGTLNIAVLQAFTGPNAFFGKNALTACQAGAAEVNASGGVLGDKLACTSADTKGDAADAVPAATKLVASTTNLVAVIGPGDETPATLPITSAAKLPDFLTVGDARYDSNTNPYFYRITASDSLQGTALGFYAATHGYRKVAAVFTSDQGAQTSVAPFTSAFRQRGGTVILSETLTPGSASYQTEVAKVLAAKPEAIVSEMDPRTAATFLSEMKQQSGGTLPPIVMTQRTTVSDWQAAVSGAIGGATLAKSVTAVSPYAPQTGPGYAGYKARILTFPGAAQDVSSPFVQAEYDSVIVSGLAMTMAKTTDSSIWRADIAKITGGGGGAVAVHTYAAGLAALKAGKAIQYIGASGPLPFDAHQNALRQYAVFSYSPATRNWSPTAVLDLTKH